MEVWACLVAAKLLSKEDLLCSGRGAAGQTPQSARRISHSEDRCGYKDVSPTNVDDITGMFTDTPATEVAKEVRPFQAPAGHATFTFGDDRDVPAST